jgi:hypothetical protein
MLFLAAILFLRELPIGSDSVYFLNLACGKQVALGNTLFEQAIAFLPCNLLFIKILMLFISLFTLIGLLQLAQIVLKNQAEKELIVVFVLGLTFFAQFLLQFENDQIGFLVGLIATNVFLKNNESKQYCFFNFVFSIILLLLAVSIWNMTALFFFIWVFYNNFFLIPIILTLPFLRQNLFPETIVFEYLPIIGLLYIGASIFLIWNKLEKTTIPFLIFFGLAICRAMFWPFAAFLAGYMALNSYIKNQHFNLVYVVAIIAFSTMLFFNSLSQFPNNKEIALTKEAIAISKDLNVGYGEAYLTIWLDGKPNTLGWPTLDNNVFQKKGFVLARGELGYNCFVLLDSKEKLKFYKCV